MATYKEVKGVTIQTRDTDPTINAGTWSSQSGMNEGRKALAGFGTYTAAIAATGNDPSTVANCESWDGSSWTEVNNVNSAKFYRGNTGTSTAGLLIGGAPSTTDTEEWDGTNWTETANYPGNITAPILLGIQTAAFAIGGDVPPYTTATNTYNGSSFTSSTAINTARSGGIGSGSTTAAVIAGGTTPSATGATELWNGSAWTEVNDLNTARDLLAGSGSSSTNSLAFGGLSTALASTESWNGTSWTEVNDLGTGRRELGGSTNGSNTQALAFGGATSPGAVQTATEQWTFPSGPHLNEGDIFLSGGTTLKGFGKAAGIPAATFASGASLNTARGYLGGAGTDHEALLAFGGTTGPATQSITEQYDGSSWTEVNDLNTARANVTGFGSSTAAIAGNGSTPTKAETESWNGSAWSEIAELNFSRSDSASAGTQTSGMIATGTPVPGNPSLRPGGSSIVTEVWNGSAWTEVGDTNTQRLQAGMAMGGSITAGIITAGEDGPGSRTVNAETWNGTSWTEVGNISQQRGSVYNFMGNSSSANIAGGYSGTARVANNEHWNGSSWTEINDLSTARNATYGGGSAVNGAVFGGDTGDYQSLTEEFISDDTLSSVSFD